MAYYVRENLPPGSVLGKRLPTIDECYLAAYHMSVYMGCEFGCLYCDSWNQSLRPLNEEVKVPLDLLQRLAQELPTISQGDVIGITSLSDAYQPIERTYNITRQILTMFATIGQSCVIQTKGTGVVDDIPLLQRINERRLAIVVISLPLLDPQQAAIIEGRAPSPVLRLQAIRQLKRANIPVGVAITPLLPYVNDTNHAITQLLAAIKEAGADFVVWDMLHINERRQYVCVNEMVLRLGMFPPTYYRELYQSRQLPSLNYYQEVNQLVGERCDQIHLEICAPHTLYAGKLLPSNEAAIYLKHQAFRDTLFGRVSLASMHHTLADAIYHQQATPEQIAANPFATTLHAILMNR